MANPAEIEMRSIIASSLAQGNKEKTIVSVLTSRFNLSQEQAMELIRSVKQSYGGEIKSTKRKASLKKLGIGGAWIAGGIAATVVTYASPSPFAVVFWGAVLWGIIEVIRGLIGLARSAR